MKVFFIHWKKIKPHSLIRVSKRCLLPTAKNVGQDETVHVSATISWTLQLRASAHVSSHQPGAAGSAAVQQLPIERPS